MAFVSSFQLRIPRWAPGRSRGKAVVLPICSAARESEYDVVVVGSGLGGLSAAALLSAGYGKSVCVCEAHSIPGGAAHSFTRKSAEGTFVFDSGPHLFSGLATGGGDDSLSANPMQHVLKAVGEDLPVISYKQWGCFFPEGYFATELTPSKPLFMELLGAASGPDAQAEVQSLLKAMEDVCAAAIEIPVACLRAGDTWGSARMALSIIAKSPAEFLRLLKSFPLLAQPVSTLVDEHVSDKFAKDFIDLLCFLLGGVGADKLPAAEFAFMVAEWSGRTAGSAADDAVLEHPVGGAAGIVDALVRAIERNPSSTVRTSARVQSIVTGTRNGTKHADGVLLGSGEVIKAREAVVSNVSAWDLPKLLPSADEGVHQDPLPRPLPSFVHLHAAIRLTEEAESALAHKLQPNYAVVNDWDDIQRPQNVALVSIPSCIDKTLAPAGYHVIHAYAPATEPYELWERFEEGDNREEYEAFKAQRAEFLWQAVERVIPGARELATITMVGSPLTHKKFLRRERGSYGPAVDAGSDEELPNPRRPDLKGLWTVGDGTFPGIGVPAVAGSAWMAANGIGDMATQRALLRKVGLL